MPEIEGVLNARGFAVKIVEDVEGRLKTRKGLIKYEDVYQLQEMIEEIPFAMDQRLRKVREEVFMMLYDKYRVQSTHSTMQSQYEERTRELVQKGRQLMSLTEGMEPQGKSRFADAMKLLEAMAAKLSAKPSANPFSQELKLGSQKEESSASTKVDTSMPVWNENQDKKKDILQRESTLGSKMQPEKSIFGNESNADQKGSLLSNVMQKASRVDATNENLPPNDAKKTAESKREHILAPSSSFAAEKDDPDKNKRATPNPVHPRERVFSVGSLKNLIEQIKSFPSANAASEANAIETLFLYNVHGDNKEGYMLQLTAITKYLRTIKTSPPLMNALRQSSLVTLLSDKFIKNDLNPGNPDATKIGEIPGIESVRKMKVIEGEDSYEPMLMPNLCDSKASSVTKSILKKLTKEDRKETPNISVDRLSTSKQDLLMTPRHESGPATYILFQGDFLFHNTNFGYVALTSSESYDILSLVPAFGSHRLEFQQDVHEDAFQTSIMKGSVERHVIKGTLDFSGMNEVQQLLFRRKIEAVSYTHLTLPTIYSV
eukprot:TRINITY_DN1745_c0_g3_i3.p1 TRINITY_DN1745_c0_g3~~TRINITY_DN1745_c0_g3_i3.p1  ORF type:complete len:545 (+),score=110.41 TRINITY_DN1745_c0_g3_i3:132-1766(+)